MEIARLLLGNKPNLQKMRIATSSSGAVWKELKHCCQYIRATTRQNVSSAVSVQARHKPACAATETSYSLEISAIESRDIILSKQRTTKAWIRLRGCAGRSVPLLFAYDIRHIFSWPGSYKYPTAEFVWSVLHIHFPRGKWFFISILDI